MNAHRRIRSYMERHKVGPLFEDLMSKLVSEMPNDPVPFLIRHLQHKMYEVTPQSVMTVAQLRRSLGDLASTLEVEKVPVHHKPSSSLVRRRPATASTPNPSSFRKSVTLYCPGNKPTMPPKLSPPIQKFEGGNLNNKKDGAQIHDSFLSIPKTEYKMPKTKTKENSKWPPKSDGNCRLILPGQILEDELLKEEFIKCSKRTEEDNLKMKKGPQSKLISLNNKGPTRAEMENCKVKTKFNCKNDCSEKEVGIELYELPEDLASEGIFICKANGFKIYKCNPKSNTKYNFAICSTCAKIMKPEDSVDDEDAILDPLPPSLATKSYDLTSPINALDTGRTISSEDLFATPRSLPLPKTPTYQYEIDWRIPSVEFLQSGSSGWDIINSDPESP